jgi:hypothetical protein
MIWPKLDEPDVIEERCIMYIALDPQITILWYQQHQQQTNKQHLHSPATSLRAPPCICLKAFYSFHFSSLSSIICIWFECKRIRFLNLGFSNLHVLIWLIQFYKWTMIWIFRFYCEFRADEEPVDQKRFLEESCKPKCVRPLIEYQVSEFYYFQEYNYKPNHLNISFILNLSDQKK